MEDEKLANELDLKEVEEPYDSEADVEEEVSFDKNRVSLAQSMVGDKYEILDVIGQGGMGSVYKVKENATSRILALKLLKPELCKDKTARKRFLLEAESLTELEGENVVSPYDYGVTGSGTPYLVMEYVEGGSLDEEIEEKGKLSVDETVDIALELCKALDYAQKKKLVHRDIKPSNVMIDKTSMPPKVMLADFGIAKLLNESEAKTTGLTQTGELFGTPAYMSPEQCEGGEIDYRSDIYSFGCLLYKILTGKEPFAGLNPVQMAVKHLTEEPGRFAKDCPDGHPLLSLQEVIFKCMRKDKEERYQKIDELVEDLNQIKIGKPVGYVFEEESKPASSVTTIFKRIAFGITTGSFCLFALLWYLTVVAMQMTFDVTDSDGIVSFFNFAGLLFCGTYIYSFFRMRSLKNRMKVGDWTDLFIVISASITYLFSAFCSLSDLPYPFSDIIPAILILSIISAGCLVIYKIWSFLGLKLKKLIYSGYNHFINLSGKANKTLKHRSIPVRISTAVKHIFLFTALTTSLTFLVFPGNITASLTTIASIGARYKATFAEPLMKFALSLNQNDTDLYSRLAEIQERYGNTTSAIETYKTAIAKKPNDLNLLNKKAMLEYKSGNFEKAIEDSNKFLEIAPENAESLSMRGKCFTALAKYEKALSDLSKCIELSKSDSLLNSGKYYSLRGLVYFRQGKNEKAIADFSMAIEKRVNMTSDYVRRALVYNAMGEKSQSNRNLKEALNGYAYNGEDYLARAYAAKQLGLDEKYEELLKKADERGASKDGLTKAILGDLPGVKLSWD